MFVIDERNQCCYVASELLLESFRTLLAARV